MIVIATLFLLSLMGPIRAGYLTGAHHYPHHPTHNIPTVLSSRSFAAGSSGTGPASGYSSSTYSQTIAAPTRVHSSFSTQHPLSGQRGSGGSGTGGAVGSSGQQQGGGGSNQHFAHNYIQNQGLGYQGGSNQGNSGGQGNQGPSVQNYGGHGQGNSGSQGQGSQGSRGQGQSGHASFTGIASGHQYQYGYNHY